jgi:tryptophan-rich hypothetical protein
MRSFPAGPRTSVPLKKLSKSKWTAVIPLNREKHFVITRLIRPGSQAPVDSVELEAVTSKRLHMIPLAELEDATRWRPGWARSHEILTPPSRPPATDPVE